MIDFRPLLDMSPLRTLSEPILDRIYPDVYDRPVRLAWRDDGGQIMRDIVTFIDLHPDDDQRTDESMKAWSAQCGEHHSDEYDKKHYRIAVHCGLLADVARARGGSNGPR